MIVRLRCRAEISRPAPLAWARTLPSRWARAFPGGGLAKNTRGATDPSAPASSPRHRPALRSVLITFSGRRAVGPPRPLHRCGAPNAPR